MKIAVVNEVTTAKRNADVLSALSGRGHELINLGMTGADGEPELDYLDIGIMTGLVLNEGIADFVVGGCGTGQGYAAAAMQFPCVFCGWIRNPIDAWLFAQINGGNCISLSLNQGYGFGSDVDLRLIFDSFFSVELAGGYPEHRKEAQALARERLSLISRDAHKSFKDIVSCLPEDVYNRVFSHPLLKEYREKGNK
jgi:ribose 5-phosphate isomerase RpiB